MRELDFKWQIYISTGAKLGHFWEKPRYERTLLDHEWLGLRLERMDKSSLTVTLLNRPNNLGFTLKRIGTHRKFISKRITR